MDSGGLNVRVRKVWAKNAWGGFEDPPLTAGVDGREGGRVYNMYIKERIADRGTFS